jgi:ribonuclease E
VPYQHTAEVKITMNAKSELNATKMIVIDAKNQHELRVAITDTKTKKNAHTLTDLHIEDKNRLLYKSNIYLGTISSIEPSLNAVFVQYDVNKRHGFLPFSEIHDQLLDQNKSSSKKSTSTASRGQAKKQQPPAEDKNTMPVAESMENSEPVNVDMGSGATDSSCGQSVNFAVADDNDTPVDGNTLNNTTDTNTNKDEGKPAPKNAKPTSNTRSEKSDIAGKLHIGQKILIQIVKEERGTKGAALTTQISLAGSYLVLMPISPTISGISRRIEGSDRDALRETSKQLVCPDSMGFIIRTAGLSQDIEQLQWDLDTLVKLWQAIEKAEAVSEPPVLIHQESDVVVCAVRDHLRKRVGKVIINDKETYDKIRLYLSQIRPDFVDKVTHYTDNTPLFCHLGIENQIEQAHQREVRLASGGSIIIDHTEALISIDVNSARAKGTDIEDTAYQTNLDAADEIGRQLRLRDIGGLIVIDFIDMGSQKHQRDVENHLRKALEDDRARLRIGRISSFGLLEMSRQRLRASLGEVTKISCPRCDGQGMIQSVESVSISIIRRIQEDVINEQLLQIQIHVPLEVSAQLMNHHRMNISDIETHGKTSVLIIPNPNFQTPQYRIKKIRFGDKGTKAAQMENKSYQLVENAKLDQSGGGQSHQGRGDAKVGTTEAGPVVKAQATSAKPHRQHPKKNLVKRLWESMFQPGVTVRENKKAADDIDSDHDENIGNQKRAPSHHKTRTGSHQRTQNQRKQGSQRRRRPSDNKRTGSNADKTQSRTDTKPSGTTNSRDANRRRSDTKQPQRHAPKSSGSKQTDDGNQKRSDSGSGNTRRRTSDKNKTSKPEGSAE